jgi:hypothetical protein
MLRLTSIITIGDWSFNNCVEVEIHSGWEDMTDRCTITIPRKVKWIDKDLSTEGRPALSVGDAVKIDLGYDFNYSTYFQGYVTSIGAKTPVTIECQDAFWFLKQASGSFSTATGGTLEDVFDNIQRIYLASSVYSKYKADITFVPLKNTVIGKVTANNVSMAFVISSLKKSGIVSFMRGNTLYSGLAYYEDQRNIIDRQFNYNITDDSLQQRNADDTKIKIVVKSLDKAKTLAAVEVGDAEGDTITYLVSGVTTQAQMRERGEAELPKYKYNGWEGSFTTFGDVFIKHGDVIALTDPVIKDRNGSFYAKKVTTNFGVSGFRNTVELHKKL